MIVVTGGAGFIGSNLVRALNARGERDVLVVDDLADGTKFRNLVDLEIADYLDMDDFERRLAEGERFDGRVRAVFHQGACSDTTEWDGRYVMARNYAYSKAVLAWCQAARVPLVYASSASVYGAGRAFSEDPANESALNVYGYSKLLFDRYLRARLEGLEAPVAGLRYFNVYGPGEHHKGRMASVVLHFHHAVAAGRPVQLFEGTDGYGDGEQRRDFVHVDDVAAVNLWLLDHPEVSGVFNVGTGTARTFNDVARAVIAWHGNGEIHYIPFPDDLTGRYQSFTEADIGALRAAGYEAPFLDVEAGVGRYLDRVAGAGRT